MNERIKALYKLPFRYDNIFYIFDADSRMVADFGEDDKRIRTRGWGRIQQLPDPIALADSVEAVILKATKDHPLDPIQCVAALNAAWEAL